MQWNDRTPGQTEIKTGPRAALWSTSHPRRVRTIARAGTCWHQPLLTAGGSALLRFQCLVEMIDGALPRKFGCGFLVTRRRVVMKAMIRLGVHVGLVLDAVCFERGFVFGPPLVDV